MEKKLASILRYFAIFGYFPKFEDVYTFFPVKISEKKLKILYEAKKNTVGEYGIKRSKTKYHISKNKLDNWRFRLYIKLISIFSQIKLVGLSGSISMMNADTDDDIDLFIISSKNRLFTARFLATTIAFIMGLKRALGQHKAADRVCLNLFFDEGNLAVPKYKQTLFVGHEVLQMKPIINKDYSYERFLSANSWVLKLFPNTSQPVIRQSANLTKRNFLENLLKKLQLKLINRHKTTELITDTQLWFHPDDFEKKIKDL